MLQFLTEHLGTIAVVAVLALIVALIIRKLIKDKRSGKACACDSGCASCPNAGICHDVKK